MRRTLVLHWRRASWLARPTSLALALHRAQGGR